VSASACCLAAARSADGSGITAMWLAISGTFPHGGLACYPDRARSVTAIDGRR
jgi:hypothetical protein